MQSLPQPPASNSNSNSNTNPALVIDRNASAPLGGHGIAKFIVPVLGFTLAVGICKQQIDESRETGAANRKELAELRTEIASLRVELARLASATRSVGHGDAISITPEAERTHESDEAGKVAKDPEVLPTETELACITEPSGTLTESEGMARGIAPEEVRGDLWLFICPGLSSKCWPQSPDALHGRPAERAGQRWSTPYNLGGPAQSYSLLLYEATPAASRAIGDKLSDWASNESYPGLFKEQMPKGLSVLCEAKIRKERK